MKTNANFITSFFSLWFWATLGGVQDLLLALHSDITPVKAQGTIWDSGDLSRLVTCKTSILFCCTKALAHNTISTLLDGFCSYRTGLQRDKVCGGKRERRWGMIQGL